ncbi:MAG: protein kinase [Deltaproteobacteria bacterium]|nr:protein kinase [Deltaproteobacteria bacterium]
MSESSALALGPFQLHMPIGRGGMGEVWGAEHRTQQLPVAVKVMTAERARDATYRAAFAEEVRAVARLEHPGITAVFDHGEVDEQAEKISQGRLVAGSPYLVMELAQHGTLYGLEPVRSFAVLRVILMELLDALAHAHARGVVHRDIKPANVLVGEGAGGRRIVKLSDFGIAHAVGGGGVGPDSSDSAPGTPGYMAAEQILGDTHRQGPWTDLYALGCVAYRLASGQAPFSTPGADVEQVFRAHLNAPVPPMVSRFPVPPGFLEWLGRLLHKAPFCRFVRAADAARALVELDDVEPGEASFEGPDEVEPEATEKWTLAPPTALATRVASEPATARWAQAERSAAATQDAETPAEAEATVVLDMPTADSEPLPPAPPQIPKSWRRPEAPPRPLRMIGVGLGLYGLRPLPLVGRERERDAIWAGLRGVQDSSRSRLVLLRGSAGTGKSCLAEWMGQRADEVGAATVLKATYSPIQGPADGLRRMLARQLRCIGLDRDGTRSQIYEVLQEQLDDDDASYQALALTELISPAPVAEDGAQDAGQDGAQDGGQDGALDDEQTSDGQAIYFSNWAERYAVVYRLLAHLCAKRPVILWLDDVQWGASSIGFAQYVLQAKRQLPVLVLATLREEGLADRTLEALLLERLMGLPHTESLHIEPLGSPEHRALVHELVGLEGELARQVCQRTAGNPLFAVQLIGDWVQRGVLEVGKTGFRLRAGERADLPDDIHQLWQARVDRLESRLVGQPVRRSLEVAAALGDEVDQSEWRLACRLGGWQAPTGLVEVMLKRRLAKSSELGWAFTHGMLRESLKRSAQAENRWQDHHRLCAAMVKERLGSAATVAERLARHLLAAGDLEQALAPLLAAADRRCRLGDCDRARALTDQRQQALVALGVPNHDPRWATGWLVAARVALDMGEIDNARTLLQRAATAVTERPSALSATVLRWQAEAERRNADNRLALELADRGRAEFAELDDMIGVSDCLRLLADCHLEGTGKHETARELLQAAQDHYRQIGDGDRLAQCGNQMSKLLVELDLLPAARDSVMAAINHHEQRQNRWQLASCHNQLGEIARLSGDHDEARGHYDRAIELLDAMGSSAASVPWLNIALMMVQRGDYAEALPVVAELRRELGSAGERRTLSYLDYGLLTCLAHEHDWSSWERQYQRARQWRPATARVDKDLAMLAQQAGDFALEAGEKERARQAYGLAREHWAALGKRERVQAVDRELAGCEG